ncbi:MAG: TetR/AcrR family transcriptional regulator, partial [Myxococcota bacterium]
MNQPSVYSREGIVDAALDVIREQGWSAASTRAIAKKLGSSTMPIYSHLHSRDELEKETRRAARDLLQEHQLRSYTGEPLLDLAFGYVAFARDERNLFRFLFLEASGQEDGLEQASHLFEAQ